MEDLSRAYLEDLPKSLDPITLTKHIKRYAWLTEPFEKVTKFLAKSYDSFKIDRPAINGGFCRLRMIGPSRGSQAQAFYLPMEVINYNLNSTPTRERLLVVD